MKNAKSAPPLPSGLVSVKSNTGQQILVGVNNSQRMLAQGFDVDGTAPNHYRRVELGNFGLVVFARTAVEVRVILDGKLLLEQICQAAQSPTVSTAYVSDKQRFAAIAESMQPHWLDGNAQGEPFVLRVADSSLTDAELVAQQIHPEYDGPTVSMERMQAGKMMVHVRADYDPQVFFDRLRSLQTELQVEAAPPESAPRETPQAVSEFISLLNDIDSRDDTVSVAEVLEAHSSPKLEAQAVYPEDAVQPEVTGDVLSGADLTGDENEAFLEAQMTGEVQLPMAEPDVLPLVDPQMRPLVLAPSHGYLVIGVRAVQQLSDSEGPHLPDAFTYVGFQLNPWKRHTRVLSQLMHRMRVPSKESLDQSMVRTGFSHEVPAKRPVCACCKGGFHKY